MGVFSPSATTSLGAAGAAGAAATLVILVSHFILFFKKMSYYLIYLLFDVTKQKTPNVGVLIIYLKEIKISECRHKTTKNWR